MVLPRWGVEVSVRCQALPFGYEVIGGSEGPKVGVKGPKKAWLVLGGTEILHFFNN